MVKFAKTETVKEKFYATKKPIKTLDVNVDNIIISKLMTGYLDNDIRPLLLIMPKMSGYVKTLKVEDEISKLMSFRIDDEKLLEKYNVIWKILN